MRAAFQIVVLPLCLTASLVAQEARPPVKVAPRQQLLSPDLGQTLADFVQRSGPAVRPRPDCSHLVHMLYSRAGLDFAYQGSRVLHRGAPEFARVRKPQPGDLAVWLGHVGIVLSPQDKTFLSSVRSGIITESWTNDYWSARGRPRFFRYIVGPNADLSVLAGLAQPTDRMASRGPTHRAPLPAEEPRSIVEDDDVQSPALSSAGAANDGRRDFPAVLAVLRQRSRPDRQQVAAAFLQGGIDAAQQLTGGSMLDPARPLSIFDRLEVKQVTLHKDEGTVVVRLAETLVLERGKAVPGVTIERELTLDRRDGVWVISDPQQRLYLPREQAVEVFERQLQLLLSHDSVRDDKRGLIKALNILYDREAYVPGISAEARRR